MRTKSDQIVEFILAFQRDRGYPPTIREIGDAVRLRSTATVSARLDQLEGEGRIRRDQHIPRSVRVVG